MNTRDMPIRRCAISIAVVFALALFSAAPALGATHTWIGPTNGEWSEAANWSGASKPTNGESGDTIVQFGSNTTSTMDIAGLVVDQIRFTGANNTINGSTALTVNGSNLLQNIVSEAGGNTLGAGLPIALTGAPLEARPGQRIVAVRDAPAELYARAQLRRWLSQLFMIEGREPGPELLRHGSQFGAGVLDGV